MREMWALFGDNQGYVLLIEYDTDDLFLVVLVFKSGLSD